MGISLSLAPGKESAPPPGYHRLHRPITAGAQNLRSCLQTLLHKWVIWGLVWNSDSQTDTPEMWFCLSGLGSAICILNKLLMWFWSKWSMHYVLRITKSLATGRDWLVWDPSSLEEKLLNEGPWGQSEGSEDDWIQQRSWILITD